MEVRRGRDRKLERVICFDTAELNSKLSFPFLLNLIVIEYLDESVVENLVKTGNSDDSVANEAVLTALREDKDVVSGIIEGGFTVWQGTRHLLNFLDSNDAEDGHFIKGKRVLDLGCGAGLLGLYALEKGASCVVFQDYNELILRAWTISNVSIATGVSRTESVSFYSGDWHDLSRLWRTLPDLRFDLILTAETIYRPELYTKLHEVLDVALARNPDSSIIMANKLSYYGIGGNIYDFVKFVEERGAFSLSMKQLTDSGITYVCLSMKRILSKYSTLISRIAANATLSKSTVKIGLELLPHFVLGRT
ncbi:unnamed protein product [Schistocephalus solidus]|uniref:protein-histidine N-methyltransferase n=1 Tax=Schistocephalus solidus TaxID=70667 RepID=A0A183T9P1_SCHSO|nr:unnamed protein product [Schistocephalus solidus]